MKKKRQPLFWILLVIILCILCVCAIIAFMWWRGQGLIEGLGNPLNLIPNVAQPTATALPSLPAIAVTDVPTQPVFTLGAAPVLHLAGRSDIVIPKLGEPSDNPIFGCPGLAMELVQETCPAGYRITPGSEFTFSASGRVNYYGGPVEEGVLPDGNPNVMANIEPYGGISGYTGPSGALVGVFLDDAIPNSQTAPERINFNADGVGVDFERLEPQIGQVFFIGDGKNAAGKTQVFVAPLTATRLYIGLIDAPDFQGVSSCYSDNTGGFEYTLQSNQPYQPLPPGTP